MVREEPPDAVGISPFHRRFERLVRKTPARPTADTTNPNVRPPSPDRERGSGGEAKGGQG